jgi:hypothetical protein
VAAIMNSRALAAVPRARSLAIRSLLGLLSALALFCAGGSAPALAASSDPYVRAVDAGARLRYERFEASFRQFIRVVESSLQLRKDAHGLLKALNEKLSRDEPLTAADQRAIRADFSSYQANYEDLRRLAKPFGRYADEGVEVVFPFDGTSHDGTVSGTGERRSIHINPADDLGRVMLLEFKMWLAAKLVVFDNYVVAIVRYQKRSGERRQFNLDNVAPQAKRFLEFVTDQLLDGDQLDRMRRGIRLATDVEDYQAAHPTSDLSRDKDNSYMDTLILGSYAFRRIPNLDLIDEVILDVAFLRNSFFDEVVDGIDVTTSTLSELFGNAVGLYAERSGKLLELPDTEQRAIGDGLEPLDILLEKTPFRLTDRFIPGHWGHVGIWVGDENDIPLLKRLGVWQALPAIEATARARFGYEGPSFRQQVRSGRGVIEALRDGVTQNTFRQFLNIDDLAVLRAVNLTDAQKKSYLLSAFRQIGKEYDFNFDVETNQSIVCSELVYLVYDDFEWPVAEVAGRYTVSPDNIAALVIGEDAPFRAVLLYHDGVKLPRERNRWNFEKLLKGEYDQVVRY